jgi:hypothetical protein
MISCFIRVHATGMYVVFDFFILIFLIKYFNNTNTSHIKFSKTNSFGSAMSRSGTCMAATSAASQSACVG